MRSLRRISLPGLELRLRCQFELASMLAVSSTRTAVIIPARAIETRMALPIGAVAQ